MISEEQKKRVLTLIAALRSGKYQQTRNQLRNGDYFCCLGVACDLHDNSLWQYYSYLGTSRRLADVVQEWFGFSTCFGPVVNGATLSHWNDNGASFTEIAYMLENWVREQDVMGANA